MRFLKLKWSEQSWMCRGVSSRGRWGAAARKVLSLRVWYLGLSVPQKSKVGRLPANGRLHGDLEHFCATPGSPGERRGKCGANCSMNVGWTKSAAYVRRAVGCEGAGVGREWNIYNKKKRKYGVRTHVKVVLSRIIKDLEERSSIVVVMERNMEVGAGPWHPL